MNKIFAAFSIILFLNSSCLGRNQRETKGPLFIVTHYTTHTDSIKMDTVQKILNGKPVKIPGYNKKLKIYIDTQIYDDFNKKYPSCKGVSADFIKNKKLQADRNFLGISDRRGLQSLYKILYIDNTLPWGTLGDDYVLEKGKPYLFRESFALPWKDDDHITVVQTGVTAMTRAFVRVVNRKKNILYPVRHTMKITKMADLSMTSNEVSFMKKCPPSKRGSLVFCSPMKYFKILLESGFDIIELTGNHNNDYGSGENKNSIMLLKEKGIKYFGGGLDKGDAYKILYVTVKGVRFSFVGFNQWGPAKAWAETKKPGAARLHKFAFKKAVDESVRNADIRFVTVQWGNENNPVPHRSQKEYFRMAAVSGADIMVSSSAHRAMGLEFYKGKFISYGLGNYLFDQMQSINHRRGMIARHHFYGKRHISTELIPYLMYEHCQPRPIRGSQRKALFRYVFSHSLGKVFK